MADEAELLSVGVTIEARGQGLARSLLAGLAAEAHRLGARTLHLEVSAENAAALSVYARLGFRRQGLRRGYYHRPGRTPEDAILLAWDLEAWRLVD
jgi:ribosomal-protein-alanine N-acetyltransferase